MQHHGNGGGFVPSQTEVFLHPLDQLLWRAGAVHPVGKGGLAEALAAAADQNDGPAAAHSVLGVIQCLLRLIKVEILGGTALADDDDISPVGDRLEIKAVKKAAAGAVGGNDIAGGGEDDLLVRVQHDVENKINTAD